MVSVVTLFYSLGMAEGKSPSAMLIFCTEFTFGHVAKIFSTHHVAYFQISMLEMFF